MLHKIIDFLFRFIFAFVSIKKNKIIFDNFGGRGIGDNPGYIAWELLKRNLSLDLVWVLKDLNSKLPQGVRGVKYKSLRYFYEVYTSKIRVDNVKVGINLPKKKGQICVQTWHADFYLKYVEGECEDQLNPWYVSTSKADSKRTDLFLSGSDWQTNQLKKYYWLPETTQIFECGVPRNDLFFSNTKSMIKTKFVKDYSINILVYAPTFRDDFSLGGYDIDLELLYKTIKSKFGGEWCIFVRLHPNVTSSSDKLFNYNDHIINASFIDNGQELLYISDLLITDYSSTMMDLAIMYRPVFLYASDIEHYRSCCRDIRPMYYDLPFDFCESNNQLMTSIQSFDYDLYKEKLKSFFDKYYHSFDDGHASKRVADWIIEKIKG